MNGQKNIKNIINQRNSIETTPLAMSSQFQQQMSYVPSKFNSQRK